MNPEGGMKSYDEASCTGYAPMVVASASSRGTRRASGWKFRVLVPGNGWPHDVPPDVVRGVGVEAEDKEEERS